MGYFPIGQYLWLFAFYGKSPSISTVAQVCAFVCWLFVIINPQSPCKKWLREGQSRCIQNDFGAAFILLSCWHSYIQSFFSFASFLLKYDLHMLHFGKKMLKWNKGMKFLWCIYSNVCCITLCGKGILCVCVNWMEISALVIVYVFWT